MNDLISVIIPVFNSEKYLVRCLESVLNNTYKNLEIILVDDGSTDGSENICDYYGNNDKRVVVIHKENEGTAIARNTGIENAKGDYFAFLDNDDYISPCFYEYMLKAMKDTCADVVVCEMTREDNYEMLEKQLYITPNIIEKKNFILGTYKADWTRNTAPWNKLYKRCLFDDIRFPEGKGYEDAYTTYRVLFEASKICHLKNILYCWYKNEESYSSKKDNAKKLLFREEALQCQAEFYISNEYKDVSQEAMKFYINQLFLMVWHLDHDYTLSTDTILVREKFVKKLKKLYIRKYKILSKEDRLRIAEYIFPLYGAFYRKVIMRKWL